MRAKQKMVQWSQQAKGYHSLTQATLFVASVSQLDDPQAPKQLPTKGGNSVNWRAIRQLSTQPIGHTNTQLLHQFSREGHKTAKQAIPTSKLAK